MERLIHNIIKDENSIVDSYLSDLEKEEYLKIINGIKEDQLYKSKIHGLFHSEKVCLFAFIIAKRLELNETDMQIIIDAALYHDIGRQNDTNDSIHGYASAYRIDRVLDNKIYKDEENLNMLKSIIDSHSVDDEHSDNSFGYYFDYEGDKGLIDGPIYDRFIRLNNILKDADGLDRNRFVDGYCFGLDERFLRLAESKKLIQLSREINDLYTDNYAKEVDLNKVNGSYNACIHGIGFDFFKMRSILDNGILSASTLRDKKIEGVKNFNGGNTRNWISVVDASLIDKGYTGFETFIKNSINFICNKEFLVEPLIYSERSVAMEKGLPFNKSDHKDERYVYKEIVPENIDGIVLFKTFAQKKIDEAVFIYNCLDYRTFLSRVSYYIDMTNADKLGYDKEKLDVYLLEYKIELDKYNDCKFANIPCDGQKLVLNLTAILNKINTIIIQMIKKYYCSEMKTDANNLTMKDIVTYELSKTGKEYSSVTTDDQVIFATNEKVKKYN